jgi:predicted nucleic acid-binding protein
MYMISTSSDALFIDSNVLIYASVPESPLYTIAKEAMATRKHDGVELWVSRQILREYLSHLSRPQTFTRPIPMRVLTAEIRAIQQAYRIAEDGPDVTERLLKLLERVAVGGKQVHDANIVATMQIYGIRQLLTHNTSHFDRFSKIITVVPL